MNYQRIHDDLIAYLRSSSPRDRLFKRSPKDPRLQQEHLYVESHHIIPRSLGGLDCPTNLVETLPEEHLFLHMLRFRIHGQREDALAVRLMLNGFDNKPLLAQTRVALTKQLRMGYAWIRSHAQQIRQGVGRQTPDGKRQISDARRGRMPARDSVTGELVGSVPLDHPNVVSGRWVHHTKGRKLSASRVQSIKETLRGQSNPNASGLSDEYFVEKGLEVFREFGVILSWGRMLELSQARGFPWIKSLKSRFNGTGLRGYYEAVSKRAEAPFNSYLSRTLKPHPLC